jgi:ribonuclease HI
MAFACETLINLGVDLDDTIIMCDCLTLVMKVNAEIPIPDGKNLLVDAAWEKISTAKSLGLSFSWIRGHSVSKWNCIADKLAGTAAKGVKRSDGKDTNT